MESDEDKAMPTLQGFLEMRENPVAYGFLCNRLMPSIVGSYKWKSNFRVERLSTFVTVTDEALTLLFLENSWEKWKDMANTGNDKESSKHSVYSLSGKGNGARKYQGWNQEGLERMNELVVAVKHDRKVDKNRFEKRYLEEGKRHGVGKEGGKRSKVYPVAVEVFHELFGESDEVVESEEEDPEDENNDEVSVDSRQRELHLARGSQSQI